MNKENKNIVIAKDLSVVERKDVCFEFGVLEFENFGEVEIEKIDRNEKIVNRTSSTNIGLELIVIIFIIMSN